MENKQVAAYAEKLVGQLERWRDRQDRGTLAKLRKALSPATAHEAWFVLGGFFGTEAINHPVFETVAGCFAYHPQESKQSPPSDFGTSMRDAMLADGCDLRSAEESHARFRRLLACSGREEICRHVRHAIKWVNSRKRPVEIDYRTLFKDLWWWSDKTRIRWARSYFEVPDEAASEDLAGAGVINEELEEISPSE